MFRTRKKENKQYYFATNQPQAAPCKKNQKSCPILNSTANKKNTEKVLQSNYCNLAKILTHLLAR